MEAKLGNAKAAVTTFSTLLSRRLEPALCAQGIATRCRMKLLKIYHVAGKRLLRRNWPTKLNKIFHLLMVDLMTILIQLLLMGLTSVNLLKVPFLHSLKTRNKIFQLSINILEEIESYVFCVL